MNHTDRMAFTGDALLIRACGRTDFQEGRGVVNSYLLYIDIFVTFIYYFENEGLVMHCQKNASGTIRT